MKLILFLFCIFLFASACNNNSSVTNETVSADTIPVTQADTVCFQRLEGSAKQDISAVRLIILNNEVTGEFMYIPFEKDSRIGTIKGSRNGDIVKGMWTYMQEGIQDSLPVEFKFSGDSLLQKNYSFDSSTGRQFLRDTARFSKAHQKIDCSSYPQRSF
jgi:hypothetical protein